MGETSHMSAWKWMARICSKTPWMKTWSLRVYYWWKKLQYQKGYVEKEEINPRKVVFESYMGKKYACSPKALYQAMCADPYYKDWEIVWAFREPEKYQKLEKYGERQQKPHTRVVRYGKNCEKRRKTMKRRKNWNFCITQDTWICGV